MGLLSLSPLVNKKGSVRRRYLTWHLVDERVEERHNQVDENCTVEENVAPHGHVAADPEQSRLPCKRNRLSTGTRQLILLKLNTSK